MSLAITGVAGLAAASIYITQKQGQAQLAAQERAGAQAQAAAKVQADQADQAFNAANKKKPDIAGFMAANAQAAKGGISGTMLTGPQGVAPGSLTLGKSTLLGG